jgi:hypothetical protein
VESTLIYGTPSICRIKANHMEWTLPATEEVIREVISETPEENSDD